jgi:hypothetical protein
MKRIILMSMVILTLLAPVSLSAEAKTATQSSPIPQKYNTCIFDSLKCTAEEWFNVDLNGDGRPEYQYSILIRGAKDGSFISQISNFIWDVQTQTMFYEEWNYRNGWVLNPYIAFNYPVPDVGKQAHLVYSTYPFWGY